MENDQHQELIAMLTVLYKKIDDVERRLKGSHMSASMQSYLKELRSEAAKVTFK